MFYKVAGEQSLHEHGDLFGASLGVCGSATCLKCRLSLACSLERVMLSQVVTGLNVGRGS